MNRELDIKQFSLLGCAVANYFSLLGYINNLDDCQSKKLHAFYEKILDDEKYPTYNTVRKWNDINVHLVKQMWSNTSCGYEDMGGSAMSESYTIVIENLKLEIVAVYYADELIYIADFDSKIEEHRAKGYTRLPGMRSAEKELNLIYLKK